MLFFVFRVFYFEISWTKTRMTDVNERMKKHDSTIKHIYNTLILAVLGKTNILSVLDSGYRRGNI